MKRKSGKQFTLIELLVVVAIIGVLAALLLPTLKSAKDMAVRAQCISLHKQHVVCIHSYSNDWAGYYPTDDNTSTGAPQYYYNHWKLVKDYMPSKGPFFKDSYVEAAPDFEGVPRPLLCPAAIRDYENARAYIAANNYFYMRPYRNGCYVHAGMHYDAHSAAKAQMAGKRKLTSLPTPSRYACIYDTGFNDQYPSLPYVFFNAADWNGGKPWAHGAGWGVALLDGHAKFYKRKMNVSDWTFAYTRVLTSNLD